MAAPKDQAVLETSIRSLLDEVDAQGVRRSVVWRQERLAV